MKVRRAQEEASLMSGGQRSETLAILLTSSASPLPSDLTHPLGSVRTATLWESQLNFGIWSQCERACSKNRRDLCCACVADCLISCRRNVG